MRLTKQTFLKVVMGVMVVLLINPGINAKIIANYSDESFYEPEKGQIRIYIIESAGHFLKAHSDFLLFLHKIEIAELQTPDFDELRIIINGAIDNMERAKATYAVLAQFAADAHFRPEIKKELREFDYTEHRRGKKTDGMTMTRMDEDNRAVHARVRRHLENADVTSLYLYLLADTQLMHDKLIRLKASVDEDQLPRNQQLWELYRSFSKTQLFGQYTAEVFSKITGK